MTLFVWVGGAALLLVFASFAMARRPVHSGAPLFLACLGVALCFLFMAGLGLDPPLISHAILARLFWSTLLLTTPFWALFSFRFGREEMRKAGRIEKASLALLWISAGVLLVGGLSRPPMIFQFTSGKGSHLDLVRPLGQPTIVHAMAGIALVLWNLHATLDAARASGRRRVSLAVYSLVPLAVTTFYLFAEALLYEGMGSGKATLIVPASLVSLGGFALLLRLPGLGEGSLTRDRSVTYTPAVPVALGICLVLLAILAVLARWLGVGGESGWHEGIIVLTLATVFVLWVFSGLREEIRRFVDRGLYAARSDYQDVWERVDRALSASATPGGLLSGLAAALRATFGPLHVQIWTRDPASGDLVPAAADPQLPRIAADHPLRRALDGRSQALVLTGEAAKVAEVPLHLACEVLQQRYGLRVFCPVQSGARLVGILAFGPAGGRTFHPEDLELLQMIGVKLVDSACRFEEAMRTGQLGGPHPSAPNMPGSTGTDAAAARTVRPLV